MKQNKYVIGITGDIGAGKSTVTNYLLSKGYYVIDADKIAREVVEYDGIKKQLEQSFNDVIHNGVLDRKKLGEIVFHDPQSLNTLNSIMHPVIIENINNRITASDETYIFVDAPLLYESGLDKLCDVVIYLEMSFDKRINRIVSRDRISMSLAEKKIRSFKGSDYKKSHSIVVENNGTFDELYQKVDRLLLDLTNQ